MGYLSLQTIWQMRLTQACTMLNKLAFASVFRCLLFPKPVTDQVLFLDTHYSKVALVLFPSRLMVVLFCSSVSSFGLENPMKVIKDSLLYHRDGVLFFWHGKPTWKLHNCKNLAIFSQLDAGYLLLLAAVWKKLEPESNSIVVCQSLCLSKVAIISNVILAAVNSIFEAHLG